MSPNDKVSRISISLPSQVCEKLNSLVGMGKGKNRSQVLTRLIRQEYLTSKSVHSNEVMAGTITIFYNEKQRGVLKRITEIERQNIKEVISSYRVLLESNHIMEVLLVQGRIRKLEEIADLLLQVKGIEVGKLTVTSTILPPIQSKKKEEV